ncbi:hypothetical protein EV379_1213 [Microterricola gilva]|uniref:Uncharacterized protein n=1 Tax=Microterricola gilva TaxID=393267 RepID=A0A4Q8AK78_9MICO|nr:hypothetical protein [Microterricola gilva]RZU64902.1 hypothetical protein EV379_1213 [Microterricola gilva]
MTTRPRELELIIIDDTAGVDAALDAVVRAVNAPNEAEAAWDQYSTIPLNFDASPLFREHDAFVAGWAAGRGETA